jgi:hypothetical protein
LPTDEAKVLAAALLANYPGSYVTELNVLAVADSLDRCGMDIASIVVDRARFEFLKPPSVAQIYELARTIRTEIDEEEHPRFALTPGEFVEEMPPEVREKVAAMRKRWAKNADSIR